MKMFTINDIIIRATPSLAYDIGDLSIRVLADETLAFEKSDFMEGSTVANSTWALQLCSGKLYQKTTIALVQKCTGNRIGASTITSTDWGKYSTLNRTMESYVEGCILHITIRFTPSEVPLIEEPHVNALAQANPAVSIHSLLVRSEVARKRFDQGDDMALAEAISALSRAKAVCAVWDPNFINLCIKLAALLRTRFERFGCKEDINDALELNEEAVRTAKSARTHESLGVSLRVRFNHFRERNNVDNAVKAYRDALTCVRTDDPSYPILLDGLGNSYCSRFKEYGNRSDIKIAVQTLRQAVDSASIHNPQQAEFLDSLGNSLRLSFERLGDAADIDDAVKAHRDAVSLTQRGNPGRPGYLTNLGNSLRIRFESFPSLHPDGIRFAVEAHQEAVDLTPNDPTRLNNLGTSLMTLFERLRDRKAIDSAIDVLQKAVKLTPPKDPRKPLRYSNLGMTLMDRYNQFAEKTDIDDAIKAHEEAILLIPEGHSERLQCLSNAAAAFMSRYKQDPVSNRLDVLGAMRCYETATNSSSGDPLRRFRCARNWVTIAKTILPQAEILRAHRCAFEILSQIVWAGILATSRHSILSDIDSFGRGAAAYAISIGELGLALEWLETSRSVVWDQYLGLSASKFDSLLASHPGKAKQLSAILEELAHGSPNTGTFTVPGIKIHYQKLTEEREQLLEDVRTLPGFEDFLRSPKTSEDFKAAAKGPVVIINMDPSRCDAIAVLPDDQLLIIPLPNFTIDKARELQAHMKCTVGDHRQHDVTGGVGKRPADGGKDSAQSASRGEPVLSLSQVLSKLWCGIAQPVLQALDIKLPPSSSTPTTRIWWCPTGPLSGLPLHAAGICRDGAYGECISDYVISSYTPTLVALINAHKHRLSRPFKLLAVAQPDTLGKDSDSIPQVSAEITHLRVSITADKLVVREGTEATRSQILADLNEYSWVHFACHAIQDRAKPAESGFLFSDGRLEISEMFRHPFSDAECAFISACESATGGSNVEFSDEMVHLQLAAGMLLLGFKSVVTTMWSIKDDDRLFVTKHFYQNLLTPANDAGELDSTGAAVALQLAVKELRLSGASLTRWIPFIHVGL